MNVELNLNKQSGICTQFQFQKTVGIDFISFTHGQKLEDLNIFNI